MLCFFLLFPSSSTSSSLLLLAFFFFSQQLLLLLLQVQAGPPTQSVTKAELAQQMGLVIVQPPPAGMSEQEFHARMPEEVIEINDDGEITLYPLIMQTGAPTRPDFVGHFLTYERDSVDFIVHLEGAPANVPERDEMRQCTDQLKHSMGPNCKIVDSTGWMDGHKNWLVFCADEVLWVPPWQFQPKRTAFFEIRHTDADRFAVEAGFSKKMTYARVTIAYLPLTMPDFAYCAFSMIFNSQRDIWGKPDQFKSYCMLLLERDQLPPGVGQEIISMPPPTTPDLPGPPSSLPSSSSSSIPPSSTPPASPDSSSSSSTPIEPSSTEPSSTEPSSTEPSSTEPSSSSSSPSSTTSSPETTQPTSPTLKSSSSSSSSLKPSSHPPPKTTTTTSTSTTTGKQRWKFPSEMSPPLFMFDFVEPD